ncbi:MAG TPA: hypothetical protein VM865_02290 [Acidobacteriaceae bacterium]|nr:hypothetical protein [Acidobacteriaceae bacterium]
MTDLANFDFDSMTTAEFEQHLPELFASSDGGKVSEDQRLAGFLAKNPDCAALVRDLETIAETAKGLFEPDHEPSDAVWSKIATQLQHEPAELSADGDVDGSEDPTK